KNQPSSPAFSRALQFQTIAMGATVFMAQFGHQFLLKSPGNRMLQPLRFFMHFIPFHAKDLREHALDEMVAEDGALSDPAAFTRQFNMSVGRHAGQAVFGQAFERSGDSGPGYGQPVGQRGSDYRLALGFGFGSSLEVVFLGNGNHG